jgi:hypothetical protein
LTSASGTPSASSGSPATLATLGYGDIVPLSGPAKGMVILEAVIGQMDLVVVARLVSLYGRSERNNY